MKRTCLALAALLLLAGCYEEENRATQQNLPPGCVIFHPGNYNGIRVVVVRCDGRQSTSVSYPISTGKFSADYATVVLE